MHLKLRDYQLKINIYVLYIYYIYKILLYINFTVTTKQKYIIDTHKKEKGIQT